MSVTKNNAKVIVVDDEPDIRLAVKTVLQRQVGIQDVEETDNGSSALEMIKQGNYDLIISDWNMPKMSGDELVREVRSTEKDKDTPFLMLTCRQHKEDVVSLLKAGANGYVVKPFSTKDLAKRISRLIFTHPEETAATEDDYTKDKRIVSLVKILKGELEKSSFDIMEKNHLDLPILPVVGNKIKQILQDSNISIDDVVRFSEKEPVVSFNILSIANSASYAGWDRYDTLEQAALRIGIQTAVDIVSAAVKYGMAVMKGGRYEEIFKTLWEHSLACAHCSRHIADMLKLKEPDKYYLLGLLHDIGKVISLRLLMDLSKNMWVFQDDKLIPTINEIHHVIGAFEMKKSNLSKEFIEIASQHDSEDIFPDTPKEMLVIHFSNIFTREMGFSLIKGDGQDAGDIESAKFLDLNPSQIESIKENLTSFMEEIKKQH
jgi:two-component system chemotaxis response regulator CheY